jgi:methylated-DNA-[protein]-cysteine S-methyltransferase
MTTLHRYSVFETAHDFCAIAWNEAGITRLQLPVKTHAAAERIMLRRTPGAAAGIPPPIAAEAIAAVTRYFEGETIDFSLIEVDLRESDDFSRKVYAAARRVKWGQTTTYGALAKEIGGGPETARAVGQALARNPIPLIIPCHRVLAAGGSIGGFSAPGGAATKMRMLGLERVWAEPLDSGQKSFDF